MDSDTSHIDCTSSRAESALGLWQNGFQHGDESVAITQINLCGKMFKVERTLHEGKFHSHGLRSWGPVV